MDLIPKRKREEKGLSYYYKNEKKDMWAGIGKAIFQLYSRAKKRHENFIFLLFCYQRKIPQF